MPQATLPKVPSVESMSQRSYRGQIEVTDNVGSILIYLTSIYDSEEDNYCLVIISKVGR